MKKTLWLMVSFCLLTTSCQRLYNTTLENVFGYEKRELLQKSVESVKKDQVKAETEFQDAISELKKVYNFDGGSLEKTYNKFKNAYEDSREQADKVHERIQNMDRIANAMFSEWSKEIKEYSNKVFAQDSRKKLEATKSKYNALLLSARASEDAMKPVLAKLRDHELYLKHNLNAASVSAFRAETENIQSEIEELTGRMRDSIREADSFIQTLNK